MLVHLGADELHGSMSIWLVPMNSSVTDPNSVPCQRISYLNEGSENNNNYSIIIFDKQ